MSFIGILFGDETELENKIARLKEALASWKEACTEIETKYNKLKEHYQILQQESQLLKEQKEKIKEENATLQDNSTAIQKRIKGFEADLETLEPLKERISQLESELQDKEITFRDIENKLKSELSQKTETIEALSKDVQWRCIGLKDDEVGFKGFNPIDETIKIIRIPRNIFADIPDSIQNGYEVFGDSRYPAALLDTIRSNVSLYVAILNGKDQVSIITASHSQGTNTKLGPSIKEQPSPTATSSKVSNIQDEKNISSDTISNPSPSPNEERVLDYLERSPHSTHGDIASALDLDKGYLSRLLKSLILKGLIIEEDDGYCMVDS